MESKKDDYSDLYNFDAIKLHKKPTFEIIKNYFDDLEQIEKTFEYRGKKIIAKRKFTYKGGGGKMFEIKTNYLHIWFEHNNYNTHYKECKDGKFKQL